LGGWYRFIIEEKGLAYTLMESEGTVDRLVLINFNPPFPILGFEKVKLILDLERGQIRVFAAG